MNVFDVIIRGGGVREGGLGTGDSMNEADGAP